MPVVSFSLFAHQYVYADWLWAMVVSEKKVVRMAELAFTGWESERQRGGSSRNCRLYTLRKKTHQTRACESCWVSQCIVLSQHCSALWTDWWADLTSSNSSRGTQWAILEKKKPAGAGEEGILATQHGQDKASSGSVKATSLVFSQWESDMELLCGMSTILP